MRPHRLIAATLIVSLAALLLSLTLAPPAARGAGAGTLFSVPIIIERKAQIGYAINPVISDDGTFIAALWDFEPDYGTYGNAAILLNRETGESTRLTTASSFIFPPANRASAIDMSGDASVVVYSSAYRETPSDTDDTSDIFVYHRLGGDLTQVPVAAGVSPLLGGLTHDGRYIWYWTKPYDGQLLLYDIQGQREVAASSNPQIKPGYYDKAVFSDGARYMAFSAAGVPLVPQAPLSQQDVYLLDRQLGTLTQVTRPASGGTMIGYSYPVDISNDGRYLLFKSTTSNLVPGSTYDGFDHLFVYDRVSGAVQKLTATADMPVRSDEARISGDGRTIVFLSNVKIANSLYYRQDVYLLDRATRAKTPLTLAPDGGPASDRSERPSISSDGSAVAFYSLAQNLVPGQTKSRLFAYERGELPPPPTPEPPDCVLPSGINVCQLKIGDILFWKTNTGTGRMQTLGGTYFTHAAIYSGNRNVIEAAGYLEHLVDEADEVVEHSVTSGEHGGWASPDLVDWAVVRPNVAPGVISKAIDFARGKANDPDVFYSVALMKKDSVDETYCSLLVWQAFMQSGVNLEVEQRGVVELEDYVLPSELYLSSQGPNPLTTVVQTKAAPALSWWRYTIFVHSPVHVALIDPQGRMSGYDPATGKVRNEIPGVVYALPEPGGVETLSVTSLSQGSGWRLVVSGVGAGHYLIDALSVDQPGAPRKLIEGIATPGMRQVYWLPDPNDAGGLAVRSQVFLPLTIR